MPWIKRRRGRENVAGFFQAVGEHLDFLKFEPPHIFRFDPASRIVKFRHAPNTYGQAMAYRGT